MRYKALGGLAIVALAVLAFTAIGFGRDGGGATATNGRPDATATLRVDDKRAGTGGIVYVTGTTPSDAPFAIGDRSVVLKACPKKSIVINGFLAANDPGDAPNITLRGSGPIAAHKWFVDFTVANAPTDGFFGLVCKTTG
jgi:hypothetical protein